MSNSSLRIDASYRFCHGLARRSGSSFYPCFRALSGAQRRAMEALYAFTRHSDDLGDSREPVAARREQLAAWRAALQEALAAGQVEFYSTESERLLPALVDTVGRFGIPHEHLFAVLDGVEMDLDERRYATFDELAEYCHRVASAVGLACIHIWGFEGDEAFDLARQCGLAFQLTNILRDLGEDSALGRFYLPEADLRSSGYSEEQLRMGKTNQAFRRLMTFEINRTKRLYHGGAALIDHLAPAGRRVFGMMMSVYHELLLAVERSPEAVFDRRIRLGRLRKLRIAARWLFLPPRRDSLP
ncbi:MAG: squalene/phytoene synthase family protein [Pirellulales bacterium]|nr:squalene/phytoene synthase family protein [Pirellulales bacterium]